MSVLHIFAFLSEELTTSQLTKTMTLLSRMFTTTNSSFVLIILSVYTFGKVDAITNRLNINKGTSLRKWNRKLPVMMEKPFASFMSKDHEYEEM